MDADVFGHDAVYPFGESATHPIEPPCGALGALLVLAGMSLPRSRPCRARAGQSPAPCALSTGAQAPVEPQRAPFPAHPMTAHSGVSNCGFQDDHAICQ